MKILEKFKFKIKFTNIYSQDCEEEYVYDLNYLNSKKWWDSADSIKTSLSFKSNAINNPSQSIQDFYKKHIHNLILQMA